MPVRRQHSRIPPFRDAVEFRIPAKYDPSYSLLGRIIRRAVPDPLRAEAFYVLAIGAVVLGFIFGRNLLLMFIGGAIAGSTAVGAWAAQAGLLALCAAICIPGWKPAISVRCGDDSLLIRQGRRQAGIPYAVITSIFGVSGLLYWRHYRRYSGTVPFVNRVGGEVLLLHTPEAVVALGLSADDAARLQALLEAKTVAASRLPAHSASSASL